MSKKFTVAIALDKGMAASIISKEDLAFLESFANVNSVSELPAKMTREFMETIIKDADACITGWGTPGFTKELLDVAPKLRFIAHSAGSVKHMVPAEFWESNRRIASNAPIIAEDVAQTVLAYTLFCLKGFWGFAHDTRKGDWTGGEASKFVTRRLDGLNVGVVGASQVGREVIRHFKPFKCNINLSDPYISDIDAAALGVTRMSLEELISTSDVLTLHAPATESCRHMINKNNLPLIKDGALFINTARGMLIDEPEFIKELEKNRFFACLDVTDPEPPTADSPLRKLNNVLLTPHIAGGHTQNGRHMLGRNTVNELYNYLFKGILSYEVRKEMLATMA